MKFLMVYVNDTSSTKVPLGVLYLTSILRNSGHTVKLFDMTAYAIGMDRNDYAIRGRFLNFQALDLRPYGVDFKPATMADIERDLLECVSSFVPDLIGLSIMEDTSLTGLHLARTCKGRFPGIPIIVGGVYCTTQPERVISQDAVDIVCVGEGEQALPELLRRMELRVPFDDVANLWVKQSGRGVVRNDVGPPSSLDDLPFPDLSLVADRHLYAPFAGHAYKMTFVESQRGCPRRCGYCCNQIFLDAYARFGARYLRRKSIPRLIEELVYLKNAHGLNFIQFTDDDFLLRPAHELGEFAVLYTQHVGLPFWIQAEARNVTDEKVGLVRQAGCISISIGVETGSEYILREVLKRNTPRQGTLRAFDVMHRHGIRSSANVIIGVPDETREQVFETVELIRQCEPRSINSNIFIPYNGTILRDYSIERGYLKPDYHRSALDSWRAVLDMPQFPPREVEDLARTFVLYCSLPRDRWPEIEKVEKLPQDHANLLDTLEHEFWEIMQSRGINVEVPGIDYDAFLRSRQAELRVDPHRQNVA